MPFSLVPKERQFYVLFREDVDNLMETLGALADLLRSSNDFAGRAKVLRDLEHRGDDVTHRIIQALNATFITPFDRQDIYELASALDDIVDLAEETADTIVLDGIERITVEAQRMGDVLLEIGRELVDAINQLETRKDMQRHWVRIHDLENQGDTLTRQAIGALFRNGTDPIAIIKWKDVYSLLEKTIDRAEDVANILENVTIKNA